MADNVIELPGGKIVNGKLILDESPEAWKQWQQDAENMDIRRLRIQEMLDQYEEKEAILNAGQKIKKLDDTSRATIEIISGTQGSPIPPKDRPTTIAEAQRKGSIFYWSKGDKKLAIYANQLETFKLSQAYKEGGKSALSQARKWMEAELLAGRSINFNSVGGDPRYILDPKDPDMETLIDTLDEDYQKDVPQIITDPSEYGFGVSQDYDMALPTFDEEMGTWTAAHDLASRAQRKWDAGIRPTGDVQAEWDRIKSEPAVVKSNLPLALQEALTSGVGGDISKAFIEAQIEKGGLLPDVDFPTTDPETQLVGADIVAKAKAVPDMGPPESPLESLYKFGGWLGMPSAEDIYKWGGSFNWPSTEEIVEKGKSALDWVPPWVTTPEVLAAAGEPAETDFDAYARAQQTQQLANEYRDMYQEKFSDFPGVTGINAVGSQMAIREPPSWEERYPLAPQEWGVDDAGLADRQWIDPHPLAINVDLGEYYKIPPDQRDKIYKPPESRWDASRSERMPVDVSFPPAPVFPPVVKEEVVPQVTPAWLNQGYPDDLPEYDVPVLEDGRLAGMQEGVYGPPDPLQRVETAPIVPQVDVLDQPWMGVDEDALPVDPDIRYGDRRKEVGDFDNFVGDDKFRRYIDRNPDAVEGLPPEKVSTLLDNPALQEAYLRERWYLTNQRFFARDYKRDELFRTPGPKGHMVSREPEFFKLM